MSETKPTSYCEYVAKLPLDDLHRVYHDTQYGFPLDNDDELFGRLILEINQAGLSWTTILKKQHNFREAYSGFEVRKIARYEGADRDRLLQDAGIIRNRLKVDATIYNAREVVDLQKKHGSFANWIEAQGELSLPEWVKLFKKHFKFTGGEITKEFLMSTGYIDGAHIPSCPVYKLLHKR